MDIETAIFLSCCKIYGIGLDVFFNGDTRIRCVSDARAAAMYLLNINTNRSKMDISRMLGKNYSTAYSAIRRVHDMPDAYYISEINREISKFMDNEENM